MPDHKEMGRKPTDRERDTTFAPHQSPSRQADGDPGAKRPRLAPDKEPAQESEAGDVAGKRGQWQTEE